MGAAWTSAAAVAGGWLWLLAAAGALLLVGILRRPLAALCRLAVRTGLAFCALAVLAPLGRTLGADLGVNLFNALALGLLGGPGLGLLLLLRWALP